MANWCSTSYVVCSENKGLLQTICDAINKCNQMDEPLIPKSSSNWAGNIFRELGFKGKADRTFWSDARIEDGVLKFFESSAWSRGYAIVSLQEHCVTDKGNVLDIYFASEESGCEIYETNDTEGLYFPERYCIYGYDGLEYYNTFEEVLEDVHEIFGANIHFDDIKEMNKALKNAEKEIGRYHVYEMEFVEL